jgi:myo-inositol-1(or 4)-monophosphatase
VRAVDGAHRVIAQRADAEVVVAKGRFDLVTGTDLASQEAIRAILEREWPQHAFVAEENGRDQIPASGSYWLVDPICGTRNFASGLPLYAVNVALVEDGNVVLGVVGDAARGDIYVAQRGRGAFRLSGPGGGLVPIRSSDQSATITLDPGRPGGPTAGLAARVIAKAVQLGRWEVRILGTTLDLVLLASGALAAVWHFSQIPPLHFAPGVLISSEAGAYVSDNGGAPWELGSEGLVAAASPSLHRDLLSLSAV